MRTSLSRAVSATSFTDFSSINSSMCFCLFRTRRIRFCASDGGDGGGGGSVVVVAEPAVHSLSGLKPQYRGRSGDRGSGGYRIGATGRTVLIK